MAFVIPILEGFELIGEAAAAAFGATEAAGAAGAAAAGYELVPLAEAEAAAAADAPAFEAGVSRVGMTDELLATEEDYQAAEHVYEMDWNAREYSRIATEDPDAGEGYPVDIEPYQRGMYRPVNPDDIPYVMNYANEGNFLAELHNDPLVNPIVTVGAGKAIFVAGMWYILDPVTGAPVYAIFGDDPRVDSLMHALGYTDNAKSAGLVMREWFAHLFGNDVPYPADTSLPPASESLQPSSQRPSITTNYDQFTDMSSRPRKRPRTDSTAMVPSSSVMAVPRPLMVARPLRRRKPKVTYYTRTLGRIITINFWRGADGGELFFQLLNPLITGVQTGGVLATHGITWAYSSLAMAFKLSLFDSYQDLTNGFDQYRIKSVSINMLPGMDSASVETNYNPLPSVVYCEDKDDANLGGSVSNPGHLNSKQGGRVKRMDEPFSIRITPKAWLQDAQLNKSVVSGGWLPTQNPDALHYGFKLAPIIETVRSQTQSSLHTYLLTFVIKAVVECKHAN